MKNSKRGEFKSDVGRALLAAIGVAGIIVVGMTAPNIFQALPAFGIGPNKYYTKNALGRLLKKGWIEFRNEDGKRYLKLTDEGHRQLVRHEFKQMNLKERPKWDKKWRILIFDIKEVRRYDRDKLRKGLIELGFKRLQNSVWVYPYDCEDLLFLLKTYYGFGKDVLYITAERIENDRHLIEWYDLS